MDVYVVIQTSITTMAPNVRVFTDELDANHEAEKCIIKWMHAEGMHDNGHKWHMTYDRIETFFSDCEYEDGIIAFNDFQIELEHNEDCTKWGTIRVEALRQPLVGNLPNLELKAKIRDIFAGNKEV